MRSALGRNDLAQGISVLAQLFEANYSPGRVVALFPHLVSGSWKAPSAELKRRVIGGERLSTALGACGPSIPRYVIAVIRAGEEHGATALGLRRAASEFELANSRRSQLTQSLAYPTVLAVSGVAVCALIVGVVLPRFAEVLADMQQTLPASARLVLKAVQYLPTLSYVAIAIVIIATTMLSHMRQSLDGARQLDRLLLRAPLLGSILRDESDARVCGLLATLLESHIAIGAALRLCEQTTSNQHTAGAIRQAKTDVVQGASLSVALARNAVVHDAVCRMVRIGEETGALAEALQSASRYSYARMTARTSAAVRWSEPIIVITIAAFVATIALVLLQTVYSVRPV